MVEKFFLNFIFFIFISLANGCDLVYNQIGINPLFDICRYACKTDENEGVQLRMMILGALHNIINSNGTKKKTKIINIKFAVSFFLFRKSSRINIKRRFI